MKIYTPILVFALISICSCTTILDSLSSDSLKGCWESYQIEDVNTSTIIASEEQIFPVRLNELSGDSFRFDDDGNFDCYTQNFKSDDDVDGTWDSDITTITFTLASGKVIKRKINTLSGDELILEDTLSGRAKLVYMTKIN